MRHSFSEEVYDLFDWEPIAPPPQPPRDLEEDQYTISDSSFLREVSELYDPPLQNGWQHKLSRMEARENVKEAVVDQMRLALSPLSPRAMRRSSMHFSRPPPPTSDRLTQMLTQILA